MMSLRTRVRIPVCRFAIGFLVLLGCTDKDRGVTDSGEPVVWDSSGIIIVENSNPTWEDSEVWTVDPDPFLEIGDSGGDAPTVFGVITGLTRLSDGTVVIADGLARELKFFDSSGVWFATTGGPGEGPDEFGSVGVPRPTSSDSVRVFDFFRRRFVVLSGEGEFGRAVALPGELNARFAIDIAWLEDGSLLLQAPPPPPPANFGPDLTYGPLFRLSADETGVDSIGEIPLAYVATDGERKSIPIFLRPQPVTAVYGEGLWVSIPTRFEVRHLSGDGTLDRIVRRRWEPHLFSRSAQEALSTLHRTRFAGVPYPDAIIRDTVPPIKAILADDRGNLWVQGIEKPIDPINPDEWLSIMPPGAETWTVFDPEGRWLGSVAMPAGLAVSEVGEDYVLGVWKDSLDVDYAHVHALRKPGPSRR